ncbi:MAG: ClbS/DfsB family four-helix bundle protein [Acidimicrobiia bacterium]|nr:ClbS/DfsB family four-helix bundle protein [Acidimicrobiia bacterium]
MGRPTNKQELLAAAEGEFGRLWDAVALVVAEERERPGACEAWSVKDLLAHLDAWHEMFLAWEAVGSAGGRPEMPAPGFTWAETPALNQQLFERSEHDRWDDVVERVQASYEKVMAVIESYSDEDLFTKKRFPWTGSTSVGVYLRGASASHYAWASKLIRKWAKNTSSRRSD